MKYIYLDGRAYGGSGYYVFCSKEELKITERLYKIVKEKYPVIIKDLFYTCPQENVFLIAFHWCSGKNEYIKKIEVKGSQLEIEEKLSNNVFRKELYRICKTERNKCISYM